MRTTVLQCKRIEKRVFPKHEAMCETFDKEISKSNTQVLLHLPLQCPFLSSAAPLSSLVLLASEKMAYARCGSEVVGYIVFVRDGDIGKIIKLCVSPLHRRKGRLALLRA